MALALIAAALATGQSRTHATSRDDRPNILLVVSDDQPYTLFNRTLMPKLFASMVDKGVYFPRAYDQTGLCCPSRSEILTGLNEVHTGVDGNAIGLARLTLVNALHDQGYRTELAGKYLNSWPCMPRPEFDEWNCTSSGISGYQYTDPTINENGTWVNETGYTTDILASKVVDFINTTPTGQPLFAMFTPTSPHLPANDPRCADNPVNPYRPPSWDEDTQHDGKPAYMQRPYLSSADIAFLDSNHKKMTQSVQCLDNSIDTVMQALSASGREANTLVVFLSDNGYLYGEHRSSGKDVPYEESVRASMVVRYPPLVPEDQPFTSQALVENIDIASTIAALLGIKWGADGLSMVPLLDGSSTQIRTGALLQDCDGMNYPCTPDALPFGSSDIPTYSGVVTAQYKYIEYITGEKELYDLSADPYEITNHAGEPAWSSIQNQLAAQLAGLLAPPAIDTTIVTGPSGAIQTRTPQFTYFSQSRFATYQCRLDTPTGNGQYKPCNGGSSIQGPLTTDGTYTFRVKGTDENGQVDTSPATRTFSIATSGPDVTINSGPAVHKKAGTAKFIFSSITPGVTFQCQNALYGTAGVWSTCTSPLTYTGLAVGRYLFQVRAVDGTGNMSAPPAQWVYYIDKLGPIMVFQATPGFGTHNTSATFRWQPDDPVTGSTTCSVDGGASFDCSSWTYTAPSVSEGNHTLAITAADDIGNVKTTTFAWIVDLTPPVMNVTATIANGAYTNRKTNQFDVTPSETLDDDNGIGCLADGANQLSKTCDISLTGLADGVHTFQVVGADLAQNVSVVVTWTWTVDTVKPVVTITSGPPPITSDRNATFTFTATDASPVTFSCSLDGAPGVPCVSGVTYTNLSVGSHTFRVTPTDAAGNIGSTVSWTWTITS
jgi:arylsulfatase A-like enzyme